MVFCLYSLLSQREMCSHTQELTDTQYMKCRLGHIPTYTFIPLPVSHYTFSQMWRKDLVSFHWKRKKSLIQSNWRPLFSVSSLIQQKQWFCFSVWNIVLNTSVDENCMECSIGTLNLIFCNIPFRGNHCTAKLLMMPLHFSTGSLRKLLPLRSQVWRLPFLNCWSQVFP